MKKLYIKLTLYLIYSLLFFSVVYLLDSVPNHRVGASDYDLWLVWLYFPMMFLAHGVISRIILKKNKFYIPIVITGILCLVMEFIGDISVIFCLFFTVIGVLFIYLWDFLYSVINSVVNYYKK